MKILVTYRGDENNRRPFITEQANALIEKGINIQYFGISGSGLSAYFSSYSAYKKMIRQFKPDLIHAHYGLSGLFANFQRQMPVITTYHGSDINLKKILPLSKIAAKLSRHNIYVTAKLAKIAKANNKYSVIPCGVDFDAFYPIDKKEARKILKLNYETKYVLFSASFDNAIKNASLAKLAIKNVDPNISLIELKSFSREQVNLLLNACDVALITSFTEGSPQFIKEAMACNCPIVSTDVGSVEELIDNTEGCFLTSFDPDDVSDKLKKALQYKGRTIGRNKIKYLDNNNIADKIIALYYKLIKK